jgi:hypothetical protein
MQDQSHWREGFPALMVTDTAPLRYPYYHTPEDTPDKVNFGWLSQIVAAFERSLPMSPSLVEKVHRKRACFAGS